MFEGKFDTMFKAICPGLFGVLLSCQSGQNHSDAVSVVSDSSNQEAFVAYLQDSMLVIQSDSTPLSIKVPGDANTQVMDPAVDPDGRQIAYTRIMDSSDLRTIHLMDLSTLESNQLEVQSQNFYGPVWSADGEWIAFNIFQKNGIWKIGVINRHNQDYRMLDSLSNINYYAPTWRTDNQVVAQDLEKLYTLNLRGEIVETILLDTLIGKDFNRSSDDRYYFTKDQTEIIFQIGSTGEFSALTGPIQSVYRLIVADKKITRLTPADVHVRRLLVANGGRIYYEGASAPFTTFGLFELLPSGDSERLSKAGSFTGATM